MKLDKAAKGSSFHLKAWHHLLAVRGSVVTWLTLKLWKRQIAALKSCHCCHLQEAEQATSCSFLGRQLRRKSFPLHNNLSVIINTP